MVEIVGNFNENFKTKSYLAQFLLANKYLQVILSEEMYFEEFSDFFKKGLGIKENCISIDKGSVFVIYNPEVLEDTETLDLRKDPENMKAHIMDSISIDKPFLVKLKLIYYDEHFVGFLDDLLRRNSDLKVSIHDGMAIIKYKK